MNKTELLKLLLATLATMRTKVITLGVPEDEADKLVVGFDELKAGLEPKSRKIDLSEVTKVDKDGRFTEIQCAVSKVWLPATLEHFYEDKSGKSKIAIKVDGKMVSLKRHSRQAEAISKKFNATNKATISALQSDIDELTTELMETEDVKQLAEIKKAWAELKVTLDEAKNAKPDFSSMMQK